MAALVVRNHFVASDGKEFYAKDAKSVLDIDSIKNACNKIVTASETGCEKICENMKKVEIGKEALCVADKSLEGLVEEVEKYIKSITTEAIKPVTEEIYEEAVSKFNELQEKYNNENKERYEAYNASLGL